VKALAYDFGARVTAHRLGVSNTMERRASAVARWMDKVDRTVRPAGVAQSLLAV